MLPQGDAHRAYHGTVTRVVGVRGQPEHVVSIRWAHHGRISTHVERSISFLYDVDTFGRTLTIDPDPPDPEPYLVD